MRISGIDPGTNRVGYAFLEGSRQTFGRAYAETVTISSRLAPSERLAQLAHALEKRFLRDRPDTIALESLFFTKNVRTALAVAEARGVILLTARRHTHSIWEYTPSAVKLAVTGYGNAKKDQVRRMVKQLIGTIPVPRGDDAVDALAIAIAAITIGAPSHHASKGRVIS